MPYIFACQAKKIKPHKILYGHTVVAIVDKKHFREILANARYIADWILRVPIYIGLRIVEKEHWQGMSIWWWFGRVG